MFNNEINKETFSESVSQDIQEKDVLANIKTIDKTTDTYVRVLPRVSADGVIETEEKQLISKQLKESIKNKQDKLGYVPLNKAGDEVLGHLYLKPDQFTDKKQIVSKGYVDKKIEQIINSAPDTLDTLYELANALGNDPNFASTITNLIANKLDKTEVVSIKTPNKVLRSDNNGNIVTDLKGNADTSSKLENAFTLSLDGLASGNTSIDGSRNVSLNVDIRQASETQSGILSPEDYIAFKNGTGSSSGNAVGAKFHNFTTADFHYITEEKLYSFIYSYGYTEDIIGLVQVYEYDKKTGDFFEVITDIIVNKNIITIKSLKPFNGKIVYNLISSKNDDIPIIPPPPPEIPEPESQPEPEPTLGYTDWQEYTLTYGNQVRMEEEKVRNRIGYMKNTYGNLIPNKFLDNYIFCISTISSVCIIFTSIDTELYVEYGVAPYDYIEVEFDGHDQKKRITKLVISGRSYFETISSLLLTEKFEEDYNAGIKTITFRMRGHYKTV